MPSVKQDLILATIFGAPFVAPFAVPYLVATGQTPTLRQVAFTIWSGIAWGVATKGGSLFMNYHPEYGTAKIAARVTGRIVQAKLGYHAVNELVNPAEYKQQDRTQSKVILRGGRLGKNPYHPSNMPL